MEVKVIKGQPTLPIKAVVVNGYNIYTLNKGELWLYNFYEFTSGFKSQIFNTFSEVIEHHGDKAVPVYEGDSIQIAF